MKLSSLFVAIVGAFAPSARASDEYALLVQQSEEELRVLTTAHDGIWQISEAAWHLDQDLGTIVFTSAGGMKATCRAQIIGTYNTEDSTWLWAWDHPSIVPSMRAHAQKVREYGVAHRIESLITRKIVCTESDAWKFAAVACKLNRAQGAYRGPAGSTMVFITFYDVQIAKAEAEEQRQPNQALQTTPMTRIVYEKTIEFGRSQRGV
jgi:hypothetical protein